jgi:hypothetical protein
MASIGGMDLPYGSQTQIVRTNVLCVAVKANGGSPADPNVGVSVGAARAVHNTLSQKLPKSIAPDFTCFFEAGGAAAGDSGLTAAAYTSAFEQDQDNSGTADNVSLEDHGLLRSILQVPAISGSARPGATFTAAGASSYDTATTALAFGSAATALGQEDLEGSMAFEGILSVGATTLSSTTAAATDDLFVESDSPVDGIAGPAEGDLDLSTAGQLQSQIMETSYEDFVGNYNGASATGYNTNGGNAFTLNLANVLANTAVGSGASTTGVTTAAATTEFNATTTSTGLNTLLGTTVTSGIGGSAVILSVMSICRKI